MITRAHALKLRQLIVKGSSSLPDTDAYYGIELFEEWEADVDYIVGNRRRYNGKLYKCRQLHHSQEHYPPTLIPAIWEEIPEPGQGDTPDNPIPYDNNMALIEGKYYSQFDVVYICTRSTGQPVYANLADLIGHYVEIV